MLKDLHESHLHTTEARAVLKITLGLTAGNRFLNSDSHPSQGIISADEPANHQTEKHQTHLATRDSAYITQKTDK